MQCPKLRAPNQQQHFQSPSMATRPKSIAKLTKLRNCCSTSPAPVDVVYNLFRRRKRPQRSFRKSHRTPNLRPPPWCALGPPHRGWGPMYPDGSPKPRSTKTRVFFVPLGVWAGVSVADPAESSALRGSRSTLRFTPRYSLRRRVHFASVLICIEGRPRGFTLQHFCGMKHLTHESRWERWECTKGKVVEGWKGARFWERQPRRGDVKRGALTRTSRTKCCQRVRIAR
jgi:hypothetical protein